jgi:hypothetical protein
MVAAVNQYRMRYLSVTAAESLHAGMLRCLLRAPMSFFHINPSGRIINRLTKDTNEIDRSLAQWAAMWFQSLLQLLSTAAVIGIVTPFVLPILVPVLLMFYMLYVYFQASVREVKRLDALSRSPIFTTVSDAINVRSLLSQPSYAPCILCIVYIDWVQVALQLPSLVQLEVVTIPPEPAGVLNPLRILPGRVYVLRRTRCPEC